MATQKLFIGVNQATIAQHFMHTDVGPVADDANFTITFPADIIGTGAIPCVKAVLTYGAGAVGARTATYLPIVDTGSGLVGVEVVSYDEATGVLTLTNRSGGDLNQVVVAAQIIQADYTPDS